MFYSYTGGETQKYARFSIYQINAPKFLLLSLKVLLQKRGMGYAKVIHKKKKERKKGLRKKWSVRDLKHWVPRSPHEKRDE
jgi:hypothetical protein